MAPRLTRSLKHEYELFVEHEIENYKESVPRSVLLSLGDEAVAALAKQQQLALTELLLCEEVDRIIFRRLRLPSYQTWRKRRVRIADEIRRPEHWGLRADDVVVRNVPVQGEGHVLVAGASPELPALYLAANGCDVTAIAPEQDAVERVMHAATEAGLTGRLHACLADLASWTPDLPLSAVIVSPAALAGLSADQRARVIALLQGATADGGVHLVQTIVASGKKGEQVSLEELRTRYRGWDVTVERDETVAGGRAKTFLARKGAA